MDQECGVFLVPRNVVFIWNKMDGLGFHSKNFGGKSPVFSPNSNFIDGISFFCLRFLRLDLESSKKKEVDDQPTILFGKKHNL